MSGSNEGKVVLVVDDQKSFREAVAFEFEMLGFQTITAENGQEGLERYINNEVDLIISDIRMPVWDGERFLTELRKVAKVTPPFVFMTGFADLQIYDALDKGADYFLGKPLDPDLLPKVVEKLILDCEERWRSPITSAVKSQFNLTLADAAGKGAFELGRSGFFLASSLFNNNELVLDDLVSFSINFTDGDLKQLRGMGRIAWNRLDERPDLLKGCGVEFLHLEDSCRQEVMKFIQSNALVKVIPTGLEEKKSIAA